MAPMRRILIKPLVLVAWTCKAAALAAAFFLVFGIFAPNLETSGRSVVLDSVNAVENRVLGVTRKYLFTTYKGRDISRYVAPGAAFVLYLLLGSLHATLLHRRIFYQSQHEAAELKKRAAGSKSQAVIADKLDSKLEEMSAASPADRKRLLKEFVKIKQHLESMGKDLAFLAIDVVDSTGMKIGEDPLVISNDFAEYRQFIEARITSHGCLKSNWTPDGLMASFNALDDAIRSAQSILKDLGEFNRSVKGMKRDFVIRCGINAGHVLFDDALPLDQMSDRVIDIAGHMQKRAQPNSIFIAKQIVKPVDVMIGFAEAGAEVDGLTAYKWERPAA